MIVGQFPPSSRRRRALQPRAGQGQPADGLRQPGARRPQGRRHARQARQASGCRQGDTPRSSSPSGGPLPRRDRDRRPARPAAPRPGTRGPPVGAERAAPTGGRSTALIALVSTVVVFGGPRLGRRQRARLAGRPGVVLQRRRSSRTSLPGHRRGRSGSTSSSSSSPRSSSSSSALVLAVLRSLPGPGLLPAPRSSRRSTSTSSGRCRASSSSTSSGFGIPGLGIAGVPVDPFF